MRNPLHNVLPSGREVSLTVATPGDSLRFTRDGSDALERKLKGICQQVLSRIRQIIPASQLEAILLGGGYGRGEGGVLRTADGDEPYNDLEFYVCVRGNRLQLRRCQARLHHLASEITTAASIDVELQVISLQSLRQAPVSMFYYDLISGHRWVWGDEALLDECEHLRVAQAIPISEATRLLMNRCTGLLLAQQKLRDVELEAADADFVGRNLAKAQLALGDAVLTSFGQYHWSCLERARRLQRLLACRKFAWSEPVGIHHSTGVAFKLHPHRTGSVLPELLALHAEITALAGEVWLWLENKRLDRAFTSFEEYALCDTNKCAETNSWRNCLLNLIAFKSPVAVCSKATRHPRERLFNALTLLLWGEGGDHSNPHLRQCLCSTATDHDGLEQAYLKLWRRFR